MGDYRVKQAYKEECLRLQEELREIKEENERIMYLLRSYTINTCWNKVDWQYH